MWIDRFQTRLMLRITCYLVLYQLASWGLLIIDRAYQKVLGPAFGWGTANYVSFFLIATVVSLALMFLYDCLKLTHRVVGPLYRFRKTIQAVTAGDEVDLITLRKGDYLEELKNEINTMLLELEQRGAVVLKRSLTASLREEPVAIS
jgi:hypothetical protein